MLSQASVILFTGGCGRHPSSQTPSGREPPLADTSLGRQSPQADTLLGRHPLEQKPPWADTPMGRHPHGRTLPGRQIPSGQTPPWADTPLPSACLDTSPPPDGHCSGRYASYWFVDNGVSNKPRKENEQSVMSSKITFDTKLPIHPSTLSSDSRGTTGIL